MENINIFKIGADHFKNKKPSSGDFDYIGFNSIPMPGPFPGKSAGDPREKFNGKFEELF